MPPGTNNPTPNTDIVRFEERDNSTGPNRGNGFANNFRYNAVNDTFFVEGLAFDGEQPDGAPYTRALNGPDAPDPGEPILLGTGFAAYEGPTTAPDSLTQTAISQLEHRAIFKRSETTTNGEPLTELAIVRTGSYANYGFGGFVYQRNGNVVLPIKGLGKYTGEYAGLRDFSGRGGLEYVTGNIDIAVDFNGFSGNCTAAPCTDAVSGEVSNRRIFAQDGSEVTAQVLEAIETRDNVRLTELPTLFFRIGTDVLDSNGEIVGTLDSQIVSPTRATTYEEGKYYAVMAGDHTTNPGGEIAGIIVVESNDPRYTNVTVRETGGFIATRDQTGQ